VQGGVWEEAGGGVWPAGRVRGHQEGAATAARGIRPRLLQEIPSTQW